MSNDQKQKSYLESRVYEQMSVTPEMNKIRVVTRDRFDSDREIEMPIFSSDDKDNIDILVYTLERRLILYDHPKADPTKKNSYNDKEQYFKITRLKEPYVNKDGKEQKYSIPKGVGTYPFFPPAIIEKYEKREKIKTLVLTEGYFKAFKGAMHGWDIVGFSSITHYADKKTKTMHPDITTLIKVCKVENVVMLYDGDCLNIRTADIEEGKDLSSRPNSFFSSMLKIFELLSDYDVKIYFSYVLSENVESAPKGLDDLLVACPGKEPEILDDLMMLGTPGRYFYRLNVSSFRKKLQGIFNLKNVEQFFTAWENVIGEREFIYFGTKYKYDGKKLQKTLPKEAKDFIRVGDDYFELVPVPTLLGDTEIKLYKRKKSTITDDFGKDFIKNIAKYKAFTNIPAHTNYQQVVNNCYNKYSPIPHEPEEGDFSTTEKFLRHIFQEHYEYGLDYIQILYQYPTQILPILCLVSKENQTGKTTFLDYLKLIFVENACKVGNAELSNEFNSYTATRLIVGVDETFLEKKTTIEKIKMLSTSNSIAMQRKGVDHEEMHHFAKYILISNNEENFIYAGDDDIRYWVRKVPVLKEIVPDTLSILNDEIPAFLYYLNNRKISVAKTGRAWFDHKLLETDALRKLRQASKPTAEKEMTKFVRDMFLDFGVDEIRMPLEYIKENTVKNRYDDSYLERLLKDNMKIKRTEKVARPKIPIWKFNSIDEDSTPERGILSYKPCRPYIFNITQFLTADEIANIKPELIPETEQTKMPF